YCDEVWTGIEYQVAAHCIMEGMVDEGLKIVSALRTRHDGSRRNPYNEIECGDHYSRAMAGWSVLEALSGFRYDGTRHHLQFAPAGDPDEFRAPFVAGTGWGTFAQSRGAMATETTIACVHGDVTVKTLEIGNLGPGEVEVRLGNKPNRCDVRRDGDRVSIDFSDPVTVESNASLLVTTSR